MFRNYLAAALRHLGKSRLYAAINVFGLAIGFAVAMVITLYVRQELSYDRYLPGYQNLYRVSAVFAPQGAPSLAADPTTPDIGRWLRTEYSEFGQTVRIGLEGAHGVTAGDRESSESIHWADPEFFDVFRFRALAGNLTSALQAPDRIVLTRAAAQRLFSRDDPIGESILVDRKHTMRVAAVIEDLPPQTHFGLEMIASNRNALSGYLSFDSTPYRISKPWGSHTYLRLNPGVPLARVRDALEKFNSASPDPEGRPSPLQFSILPIADIHLSPPSNASMKRRGSASLLYGLSLTAAVILLLAGINFVNIATARASRRALEVGVRKAAGATRGNLIIQFVGESLLYALLGALLALALAEWLVPLFNKLTYSEVVVDYPTLLVTALLTALLVGVLGGIYPSLVLSAFRPATVLKGARDGGRSGLLRHALVLLQFAVLICLLFCIAVIFRQTRLAVEMTERVDTRRVVAIDAACDQRSFVEAVRSLPGVEGVACSQSAPFNWTIAQSFGEVHPGVNLTYARTSVDFGFFELYGLAPLAGRTFSRDHGADVFTSAAPDDRRAAPPAVLINETAVRRFGFASPEQAVGQYLSLNDREATSQIVGVVPDMPISTIQETIDATIYMNRPDTMRLVSIKLRAGSEVRTLEAIDAAWKKYGKPLPSERFDVTEARQFLYAGLTSQGQTFGVASAIAAILACLGMFGLASFMAERRTREVGVRKAMGAERADIVRLLMGQLSRPVLLANLLAWPLGYVVMRSWLNGFQYRIDLAPWMFIAASAVALLIAWLTVLTQALRVARAKPVEALRYE